ncbi:hypothetical protein PLESTF_001844800 [Pleodorina starrii]|nr:hypothetical protein PLESTF_001844800 [Pleodorina starrii]
MDLLTGYGSDASDDEHNHTPVSGSACAPPGALQTAVHKQQLPAQQPQHRHHPPAPSQPKMAPDVGGIAGGGGASSGLLARLPQPSATTSGLQGLPPPSGGDARGPGPRKVVSMQLPFRKELLAAALDSDDEDEPAAKRVKATGAKSRLMDFLPPPKHDTGAVRALGAAPARERPAKATGSAAGSASAAAASRSAAAGAGGGGGDHLPADFFAGGATEPLGNEAYRVRDDGGGGASATYYDASTGAYPYDTYGGSYDQSAYYAHDYGSAAAAGPLPSAAAAGGRGATTAGPAAPAGPEDLIAEALRAEQERASKRGGGGGGGVKLVEINAKELTAMDPAAREAANSARDALGPEYAREYGIGSDLGCATRATPLPAHLAAHH